MRHLEGYRWGDSCKVAPGQNVSREDRNACLPWLLFDLCYFTPRFGSEVQVALDGESGRSSD
jgi:hypothetical protein